MIPTLYIQGLLVSRPVDIVDLLAHELARVPSPLFTDSGELRTASAKSVLKTNTAQLLSAKRAQENVDVIVIDGSPIMASIWHNTTLH